MNDNGRLQHDLDVVRDMHTRELFALRRLEQTSEADERSLDRRLRELGEQQDRAARWLATEYRRTHFGKSPASWPADGRPER